MEFPPSSSVLGARRQVSTRFYTRASPEPPFVKKVQCDFAALIALGYCRPYRVDVPLHAYDLRIARRHVLRVGEEQVSRDLLLQHQARLRRVRIAKNLRIDLQSRDSEKTLQPA